MRGDRRVTPAAGGARVMSESTNGTAGLRHEPTSHSYYSQRLRLSYVDWGNPSLPPVLLLHGQRDHARSWDWVARRLQDRYHVVAPDLRGHGDSSWSTGSPYAISEYVFDLAQLVHQEGLAPFRIVAHSMGAVVALRYAATYPELVDRLVVADGTGELISRIHRPRSAPDRLRQWIAAQQGVARRNPRRYETLEAMHRRMREANPHLSDEQTRHLVIHGTKRNEDGTYGWKFDNHVQNGHLLDPTADEVDEFWASITCPVLLLTGTESPHVGTFEEPSLVARFKDARHAFIEGAGHWIHHDQLDRFLDHVVPFLEGTAHA